MTVASININGSILLNIFYYLLGVPALYNKEVIENPKSIKNQISKTLSDLYVQEWHNKVTSSSKGKNYTLFKQDLNFENYLIKLHRKHCSSL